MRKDMMKNMLKKSGLALGAMLWIGTAAVAQTSTNGNNSLVTFTDDQLKPEFTIKIDDQDLKQLKNSIESSLQGLSHLEAMKISINDLYKEGDEKSIYAATQAVGEEFTVIAKRLADMTARVYRLSALIQTTGDATELYEAYQRGFQASYNSMISSLVTPNTKIDAAMKACVSDMCATQLRDVMNDLVNFGVAMDKGVKLEKLDRFNFDFEFKSSLVRASIGETFTELNRPNQTNSAYRSLLAAIISPFVVAGKGVVKTGDNLARLIAAPKTVQLKLFAKPLDADGEKQLEAIRQSYRNTLGSLDANYKAYQQEVANNPSLVQKMGYVGDSNTAKLIGGLGKVIFTRIGSIGIETQVESMKTRGLKNAKFVAGFNASGAIAYHHELFGEERIDHTITSGLQILPYEIHILEDGRNKMVASLAGLVNMNEIAESSSESYGKGDLFATLIDHLKVAEVIWDSNYSFSNLRSFDFKVVDVGVNVPIYSQGDFSTNGYAAGARTNYSLISFRASADIGLGNATLQTADGDVHLGGVKSLDGLYKRDLRTDKTNAFGSNLSAGLQFKAKLDKAQVVVETNLVHRTNSFRNSEFVPAHFVQTSPNGSGYNAKDAWNTKITPLNVTTFQVKLDASRKLKNGKNSIGFVAEYNQPLKARVAGHIDTDLTPNYNQVLTGRLYLKF